MSSSNGVSPDMTLINELWEAIERSPPGIRARQLLLEQWINAGWLDAAEDTARELLRLDPSNADALHFLQSHRKDQKEPVPINNNRNDQKPPVSCKSPYHGPVKELSVTTRPEDRADMERQLADGYETIRSRAEMLLRETRLLLELQQQENVPIPAESHIQELKALSEGRISTVVSVRPPRSARAVARAMEADRDSSLAIVVDDLAGVVRWLRSTTDQDKDSMRETLTKRVRALNAALPDDDLQRYPSMALMHVEHEELARTYVNDETMYGDKIEDIPRANFWASEDGYAWDMSELAAALASNSGVMRNPLSRQLFSQDDVRAIVQHPLGNRLAPLQMEQSELSQGIRPATMDKLDELAAVLLADMTDDQVTSRHAIDDFLTHVATLPEAEQKAIDKLRVPATDSHTGQAFDCTIGEAVRDAQANKICLHKTGDLIGQAARYLRNLPKQQ